MSLRYVFIGSKTFEEPVGILISVYWYRLFNVYPETSKGDTRATLFTAIHNHRTNCPCDVTNPREMKGDKQDNKLSALINQRSNKRRNS